MEDKLFSKFQFPNNYLESNAEVSLKELKTILKENFNNSNALNSIKAQLRKDFINGLTKKNQKLETPSSATPDIHDRIILSSIANFLAKRNYHSSLSVFTAESGIESASFMLKDIDIANLFKLNVLGDNFRNKSNNDCLLDVLFQVCLAINQGAYKEASIQTEGSHSTARETMEAQLQQIHKEFLSDRQKLSSVPSFSIEEKLLAYQRECEGHKQKEIEAQVKYFNEFELTKMKITESNKARLAIESLRKELDHEYQLKLQYHLNREKDISIRLTEQEKNFQQSLYETRQSMQREIDEIRTREKASLLKIDLESQGLRILEHRLKEAQNVLENREKEFARREREFEDQKKDSINKFREEVKSQYQKDIDELQIERRNLTIEKRKFEEEKTSHLAALESIYLLRKELADSSQLLQIKEQEIIKIKETNNNLISRLNAEEKNISEVFSNLYCFNLLLKPFL